MKATKKHDSINQNPSADQVLKQYQYIIKTQESKKD
jgi:hypothetical protein